MEASLGRELWDAQYYLESGMGTEREVEYVWEREKNIERKRDMDGVCVCVCVLKRVEWTYEG